MHRTAAGRREAEARALASAQEDCHIATVLVARGDVAIADAGRLSIPIPGSPRKLNRPSHRPI